MIPFDYVKPPTPEQLVKALHEARGEGAVLAGGTDLHVKIRVGKARPRVVFDINELAPCRAIVEERDHLRVGAAVTMTEIMDSAIARQRTPSLVMAASNMSSRQIRNRATLGGNIVTASPAADAVPVLLAADARLVLFNVNGKRELALADFLTGPGRTALGMDEVLMEVIIPVERNDCRSQFVKVGCRKAQAISIVNLAGRITIGDDGLISDARIALGAVAPTAIRASRAEQVLNGRPPSLRGLTEAAALSAEACRPISDSRATAKGRALLVEGWTLRMLQKMCGMEA
jgi:CO/xanthine dehydrogenase FAD-binding subunit